MSKMNNILTASKWYYNGIIVPDDVIFTSDEYNMFMHDIRDIICEYGYISVGDLIDMVSKRMASHSDFILIPSYISYVYVWKSIEDFGCERREKGDPKPTDTWRLIANDPVYLNDEGDN